MDLSLINYCMVAHTDRFLVDAAVVATEVSITRHQSETKRQSEKSFSRHVSRGPTEGTSIEQSDLSRPISIKVSPKNQAGEVSFTGRPDHGPDQEVVISRETEQVRVSASDYRSAGGSQAGAASIRSHVGGASEGRGTYGSWWRSGRFGGAGGASYPRSPSEIEDEQATCGYFCASLFCLAPKLEEGGGMSMRSVRSGGGSRRGPPSATLD